MRSDPAPRRALGRAAATAAVALITSGCIILPTPANPHPHGKPDGVDSDLGGLRKGSDTRTDILLRYGTPARRLEDDRIVVYEWQDTKAVLIVFMGPVGLPLGPTRYLAFRFDDRGVLRDAAILPSGMLQSFPETLRRWQADSADGSERP